MSAEQTKLKLKFYQLDVFTPTPFQGNPLAIVHLPPGCDIPQSQKQNIAREFNLSETVFLHENESATEGDYEIKIDIFTVSEELPFAGHPTIGAGWHLLLNQAQRRFGATLLTKAGRIPISCVPAASTSLPDRVKLEVPINFKVHNAYAHPTIKKDQVHLKAEDYVNDLHGPEAVASIVKGMTFVLLQLKSVGALGRMGPYAQSVTVPDLGDWEGFVGIYAFTIVGEGKGNEELNSVIQVRTRMFDGTLEDPATGSAASTLAGWLSLARGKGKWGVEIVQGVEMGRRSEISLVVEVGESGHIEKIELAGSVVQVMEGHIWA